MTDIDNAKNNIKVLKAALKNYAGQLRILTAEIGAMKLCKLHFLQDKVATLEKELEQEREALKFLQEKEKSTCKIPDNNV